MPQNLIDYYSAIENASRQMLEAAQAEDWDRVARLEGACAVLISQLQLKSHSDELKPDQRIEKSRIMQRILRNDAEVRTLAEPWLRDLETMLGDQKRVLH